MPSFLIPRPPLSRRAVLRGLGATVALPFLNAMMSTARAAASAPAFPVRMGLLFMPNGVNPNVWTPEGSGRDFKLSPILQPLESHREDLNIFTGLVHNSSKWQGDHFCTTSNWLTSTGIANTTGKNLRCGISMDQVFAKEMGYHTRFTSLELGTEPVQTGVDSNVNNTKLYGSHIAWRTPTSPLPPEINPRYVFDRLFRENPAQRKAAALGRRSVLDLVLEDAHSLRHRVGTDDQQRLDEYLDSLRSIEQRIDSEIARVASGENIDDAIVAETSRLDRHIQDVMTGKVDPGGILRLDHTEHTRLMMDLMTLAFWTDSTRVSTFMFGWGVSNRSFTFLPGVTHSHHENSHHEGNKEKLEEYTKINVWHTRQFAYLLDRMRSIKEGDGTLLDHSLMLFGSGFRDGNNHHPWNLPTVLAGRGGGIKAGQHLEFPKEAAQSSLYLSMLQSAGVNVSTFGESSTPLPGLT